MNEKETKFAKGFIFKRPRDGAPAFVRGSMSIKKDEAIEFINSQDGDWINLDLLVSKDGQKLYFTVNDWKPEKKEDGIKPEDLPAF